MLDYEPSASLGTSLQPRGDCPRGCEIWHFRGVILPRRQPRAPSRALGDASRAGSTAEKSWEPQHLCPHSLWWQPWSGRASPCLGQGERSECPADPGASPAGLAPLCAAGTPHTAGNILGPGGSAHKRSHGAGSGMARAQPGQSAARRGHLDLRVPRCKPQQSQAGGDVLLCAKSSWTVSLPPELALPTARRGARIWELFNASANTPSRGAQPHQNVCAIQTGGEIEPGIIPGTQAGYISPKPEFVAFLHLQLQDI